MQINSIIHCRSYELIKSTDLLIKYFTAQFMNPFTELIKIFRIISHKNLRSDPEVKDLVGACNTPFCATKRCATK